MSQQPPIVVNPSSVGEQISAGIRTMTVLAGGIAAILGFLGKRDVVGLVAYMQTGAFLPVAGAIAATGAFLYGQWKTIMRKRQMVRVAEAAPDRVAVVQTKEPSK